MITSVGYLLEVYPNKQHLPVVSSSSLPATSKYYQYRICEITIILLLSLLILTLHSIALITSQPTSQYRSMDNPAPVSNDMVVAAEIARLKAQRKALRREKRMLEKQGKKERKEQGRKLKLKLSQKVYNESNAMTIGNDISRSDFGSNVAKSAKLEKKSATVSPLPHNSKDRGLGGKMRDKMKHPLEVNVTPKGTSSKPRESEHKINKPTVSTNQGLGYSDANPTSFVINDECTSLSVSPSGRHIIAGFTDGTLRLFDTTGRLWSQDKNVKDSGSSSSESKVHTDFNNLFDYDSSDSETEIEPSLSTKAKDKYVMSKSHQHFGAVACQIHAKGVITSLLMDVDCSEDGSFAFGGVLRGSTELVAVHLSPLESYHDQYSSEAGKVCILDLIKVYRYSDAKLKGFGACTRLKDTTRPEYRLFTGKGIKVRCFRLCTIYSFS